VRLRSAPTAGNHEGQVGFVSRRKTVSSGILAALLAAAALGAQEPNRPEAAKKAEDLRYSVKVKTDSRWGTLEIWSWIAAFFAAIHLVGFLAAVPLFVFSYTKTYGGGWLLSAALGALAGGFVYSLFNVLLHVPWPTPLIVSLIS